MSMINGQPHLAPRLLGRECCAGVRRAISIMEMILMWSIKVLLLLISSALVGCIFTREAGGSVCPVRPNSFVESADVYDGPVADMAVLMPDEANETFGLWNLAYVYEAGRAVNIRCKYADKTSVDISLAKKINQCRYNILKNKNLVLYCQ